MIWVQCGLLSLLPPFNLDKTQRLLSQLLSSSCHTHTAVTYQPRGCSQATLTRRGRQVVLETAIVYRVFLIKVSRLFRIEKQIHSFVFLESVALLTFNNNGISTPMSTRVGGLKESTNLSTQFMNDPKSLRGVREKSLDFTQSIPSYQTPIFALLLSKRHSQGPG